MMAGFTTAQMAMLKKFMNDSCFTHTDEWLVACVNWMKEENNVPFDLEAYKRELREQWVDADLMEMESSCLPPHLAAHKLTRLTGKYGLQVNSIQDISESSYSQWMKLKKLENENVAVAATDSNECKQSWQPKPKRCLQLTMTDGSQQIFGIEKESIPALSLNMKPGIKVVIVGPVVCRRGVLHLKPNNVRVIGGEVEALLEPNSVESLLAQALKIKVDPNAPRTQQQSSSLSNASVPPPSRENNAASSATINSRGDEVIGDFPESEDPFPDLGEFPDDNYDFLMNIDEEALIQASSSSSSLTNNTTTSTTQFSSSTNISTPSTLSNSTRNTFDRTTQQISSASTSGFGEEIEDYEDDPDFAASRVQTSRPISISTQPPNVASVRPMQAPQTSVVKPRPKAAFVPPVIKSTTATSSSSGKSSAIATSFQTARTALKTSSATAATEPGKQVSITQYLKPMPVIIDPPTPERQAAKRRRKMEAEQALQQSNSNQNPSTNVTTQQRNDTSDVTTSNEMFSDFGADNDDFDDISDEALIQIVDATVESKLKEAAATSSSTSSSSSSTSTDQSSLNASASGRNTIPKNSYPIKVQDHPYVFLKQVLENLNELAELRKVVHIRGCVSTVVNNIQVESGSWVLCVSLNDGTGYLDCLISPNILNSIIGFSAAEMKQIKATKTKEGKHRIAEGMKNLAAKLPHLNGIFAVELGPKPMIIDIIDVLLHHSTAVKERLKKLGL